MGRSDLCPGESFVHILLFVAVSVFFIIGLPLWLVGCDPEVPNGCITRSIEDGNVTGVIVVSGICCSSCKCGKSTCCCGGYNCYNSKIGVDTASGYCQSQVGGIFRYSNDARAAGEAIGNKTRVVIDPRTQVCSIDLSSSKAQWIAGMFFMCFTACCCVCWYLYCCTAAIADGCKCCVNFYENCNCCDDCACPAFPFLARQNTRFHSNVRQGTIRIMNIRKKDDTKENNNIDAANPNSIDAANPNNNNPNQFVELQETTSSTIPVDLPRPSSEDIRVDVDPDAPPPYSEEGQGPSDGGKADPDAGEIDRKPTTLD